MSNEKKSSIIKEALTDYNTIREAAETNAKNKLAEEFPNRMGEILKEELQNKNKIKKESYKKLDEGKESEKSDNDESNKESVMKNQTKETKKVVKENAGEGKPFDEKAKGVAAVEEDVKITDTVGKGDPFDEKAKKVQKVEETAGDGKPFDEKAKKPLQTEEFDVTELDVNSVGSALENADQDDEVITMDEIESEIANMENLGEELNDMSGLPRPELAGTEQGSPSGQEGDAFTELVNMRNKLDEMIKNMGQAPVEEMHDAGQETFGDTAQVAGLHNDGPTDKLIDEENPITDADIEAVLGAEKPVEEAHGVDYAKRRNVTGRHLPQAEYLSQGELDQAPEWVKESKKKIGGLIEENKKLTKKLNETKKFKETVTALFENYKSALEKYRNQLKEMAIFNTNLAHVNNLLVNEELALTQEDKIKIINEFKKIDTITASQNKYKAFLTEMKEGKKTLTESIETKVAASIQPSSKQKLDEVVEKTAYADDKHINRMKKLIEYVEHRGKKNNI